MHTPENTLLTVSINGEAHTLSSPVDVAALLATLGQPPESVAVAVNGDFVPRAQRSKCLLQDGDQVTCFQPIVGG